MAIAIDLILLAIMIAVCVNGYLKGLVISIFNLVSSLLAIAVSFVFYPVLSGWLEATPLLGWIQQPIQESLLQSGATLGEVTIEGLLGELNLPTSIFHSLLHTVGESSGNLPEMTEIVSAAVASFILQGICMLVLFLIVKIGLLFVKGILKTVTKLPILKQVDKAGGVIFGVIEAFVILTVVGVLFSMFSASVDSELLVAVENSYIGSFFYNHNLLMAWLSQQI